MKALILVGGFGTRLRPLTFSKSKPLVEFVNKPILCHQIEALVEVGVREIVLAINFTQESTFSFLKSLEERYKIKITCSIETEPLGTAGPLALAKEILEETEGDDFFVFNSDITCKFPLKQLLEFHKKHKSEGTLMVTKVEDPTKYGVIVSDEENKILRFVEKPSTFISNRINAGLYLLNKKILNRIKPVPTSIERDVFPKMADEGVLYSLDLEGFWMDIGQPIDYLKGTSLVLDDLRKSNPDQLSNLANIKGNVIVDKTAKVSEDALIGPNVVIGPGVVVHSGARILNSVILADSEVGKSAFIEGSIVGWKSKVGNWARLDGLSILGEQVSVSENVYLNGAVILPNVTVKNSVKNSGSIIMS